METIIQYCLDSKSDNIELMGNHVERSIGMPRSRKDSADWRANVSMKEFKKVKKEFDQKGINIFLLINHIVCHLGIKMKKLNMP